MSALCDLFAAQAGSAPPSGGQTERRRINPGAATSEIGSERVLGLWGLIHRESNYTTIRSLLYHDKWRVETSTPATTQGICTCVYFSPALPVSSDLRSFRSS